MGQLTRNVSPCRQVGGNIGTYIPKTLPSFFDTRKGVGGSTKTNVGFERAEYLSATMRKEYSVPVLQCRV